MPKKVVKKAQPINTWRRKSSVARVRVLENGKGLITVNEKPLEEYFGLGTLQYIVKQPLVLLGLEEKVDILFYWWHLLDYSG